MWIPLLEACRENEPNGIVSDLEGIKGVVYGLPGTPSLRLRELTTSMSLDRSVKQFVFLVAKSSLSGFEPLDQTLPSGSSENKLNPSSSREHSGFLTALTSPLNLEFPS